MKKFYPVIHVENLEQARANVQIAYYADADGVFLINHSIGHETLFLIYQEIKTTYQVDDQFKIGLNFLDLNPHETANYLADVQMLWVDNCKVDEHPVPQERATEAKVAIKQANPKCEYFGGTAFKYQAPVKDLALVTARACLMVDVITTSGSATGVAAPIEKLEQMRKTINEFNLDYAAGVTDKEVFLAIASGITSDNVLDYRDTVDIFLVSTGISQDFLNLDTDKTVELAYKIHRMSMKKENQNSLKEVFYKYWMERVPEISESEAIDHLDWELRNMGYIPSLKDGMVSKVTTRKLNKFLKEKGIKS